MILLKALVSSIAFVTALLLAFPWLLLALQLVGNPLKLIERYWNWCDALFLKKFNRRVR